MSVQVRDLIEHLGTFPGEARLRLMVECTDGTFAAADDYAMRRAEDGTHELRITGALVHQLVKEDDAKEK